MLTKRAVLYVGYHCNIRCKFCYYLYSGNKTWYPLPKCKNQADAFRHDYGNNAVDITGGEPTIYPDILQLVSHCRQTGLKPTLITNMQALADYRCAEEFKHAGIEDFLCSIHAWKDKYDKLVGNPGGFKNIQMALYNLRLLHIPFRINCVLTKESKEDLTRIASLSHAWGAKVINFISYNPFYEWAHFNVPDFQERHSIIAPYLKEALDYCDSVGIEANVRYFPFCQMSGHFDKCYNFAQLSYDPGEWDFCSWYSDSFDAPCHKYPDSFYKRFSNREDLLFVITKDQRRNIYKPSPTCHKCALSEVCDGLTAQYWTRFGDKELSSFSGEKITDPAHFLRTREKHLWEKEKTCLST